jgi:hypothetical protein
MLEWRSHLSGGDDENGSNRWRAIRAFAIVCSDRLSTGVNENRLEIVLLMTAPRCQRVLIPSATRSRWIDFALHFTSIDFFTYFTIDERTDTENYD